MRYTIEELAELLNGKVYIASDANHIITNFEFTPKELEQNKSKGLCFISISNARWSKVHK